MHGETAHGEGGHIVSTELKKTESQNTEKENNIYTNEKILKLYKKKIGKINPGIKDWEDKYSEKWIIEAIDRASQYNKKSFGYINTILENWEKNGKNGVKLEPKDKDYLEEEYSEFIEE